MKKGISKISICVALTLLFSIMFSACGLFGGNSKDGDKKYTIMYSDGSETKTLEVKNGDLYSITPIEKDGYVFLGLFDAEAGGTQYVTASGLSVAPFTDKRNIVLYPQFKGKEYTVVLDYGEAQVTGKQTFKIERGSALPALPAQLYISDKYYMNFIGWYAVKGSNSIQVSGEDGLSEIKFDDNLAKYCDGSELVLYARFEKQKYTVTFLNNDGTKIKEKTATHGDSIDAVAKGISTGGQTVIGWSRIPNGTRFDGEIEENLNLYPVAFLKESTVGLDLKNCKNDNGYNSNAQADEEDDRARHNGFRVVGLSVSNIEQRNDGKYTIPADWYASTIGIKIMANPSALPINNNECQSKYIENDTYNGSVTGTNISNKSIGKGAYYVKVMYEDGTVYEKNATNFLDGKNQGDIIPLNIPFEKCKKIQYVHVTVVYELFCGAPGFMGVWWKEFTNWRCTATMQFAY